MSLPSTSEINSARVNRLTGLMAGGGELAAWPAPLAPAVAGGCAGAFAGAAGWLAGCAVLDCPVLAG